MEGRTMSETTRGGFGRRLHRKLLGSLIVLGLVGVVAGVGTWSAFTATTANSGNTFAAGTVAIGDNDANGQLFSMSGMKPGSTSSGCIQVTYTGSLAANVKLYGTTTGSGLDPYITLTVTRGTISSGSFSSCTNFTADSTDYLGSGAGVVYSGTLQGYADDYTGGILDAPGGNTESWTTSETHAYRFDVTLQDTDSAQGKTANQVFTWESRNT